MLTAADAIVVVDEEARCRCEAVAHAYDGLSVYRDLLSEYPGHGQERHDAGHAWPFARGDGESGVQLGQRRSATAVVDGVGDPELDSALQRHGFEVAEGMAPKLCLGLQELSHARHAEIVGKRDARRKEK